MIANLIDNAIRHNQSGGYVKVVTGATGGDAVLSVRNGGAVIAADDARTLTEPFRRLTRSGEGYGLGLPIVRSVAEAHHGAAIVSAPPDGGLLVTVALPADRTADDNEVLAKKPVSLTRN